jgi:hypothetical protein
MTKPHSGRAALLRGPNITAARQRRPTLKLDGHKQYDGLVLPRVAWTMSELRNGGGGLHFEPPHWVA